MREWQEYDWQWFRCSILGCGAGPLRVRRHPHLAGAWSVGFTDSALWVMSGHVPACPFCGQGLEMLAQGDAPIGAGIGDWN